MLNGNFLLLATSLWRIPVLAVKAVDHMAGRFNNTRCSLQWPIYIVNFGCGTPPGPIFFIFLQFTANFGQIIGWRPNPPFGLTSHIWKILDPSLGWFMSQYFYCVQFGSLHNRSVGLISAFRLHLQCVGMVKGWMFQWANFYCHLRNSYICEISEYSVRSVSR